MQKEFLGGNPRPPLWSKEQFLADLIKYGSVKEVCEIHLRDLHAQNPESEATWRTLYNDVWRWRKQDEAYDSKISGLIKKTYGGRPPKDEGDTSWEDEFCREFYVKSGDLGAAADVTPYSVRQIMEFLDKGSTSYRKELAEKFDDVKMRIVGELQAMFLAQRKDEVYEDVNASIIAKNKAWIASKGLEKLYPELWGRRSELSLKGSIEHRHLTEGRKPKAELLAELWDDRNRFIETRRLKLLEAGDQEATNLPETEQPIEVEILDDRKV